jgi:predicted  nucleic acid-binding Zn-ribbon protein
MSVNVETEIELLKREVSDMKGIHVRLDSAIEKIADVSSSLHTIMAVHEEKLARQEDALNEQENQLRDNIQDLHSRITTNAKETHTAMGEMERRLVEQMNAHSKTEEEHFRKMREELSSRVGILEKWKWLIVGGSIVAGFIIQKVITINL